MTGRAPTPRAERARRHGLGIAFALVVGACAGPMSVAPSGPSTPTPAPRTEASATAPGWTPAEDTPATTPSGSTYTAPKGWTITASPEQVTLESPERDLRVTFVERDEKSGADAIAAAWKALRPEVAANVRRIKPWAGHDGWDDELLVEYAEPSVPGVRLAEASARRKGDTWFVSLIDGPLEGWKRSQDRANALVASFRAKGVVDEVFAGRTARKLDAPRLASLEAFVEEARRVAKIPGAAVAVVEDGNVVLERGFGVRALGDPAPVTRSTRFRVGSTTKPLTSLMVASLVTAGKLRWDTRVVDLLPGFRLADAKLTERLTIRNTLCACTGIPYDDLGTWFEWANLSGEGLVERMRELAPVAPFGKQFLYSNPMVSVGGYAAAHAFAPSKPLARAYEQALRELVLGPLGMSATTLDARLALSGDHAAPHHRDERFDVQKTPGDLAAMFGPMSPAGGLWSTAGDMAKALAIELRSGKGPNGERVFAERELLARREPLASEGETRDYVLGLAVWHERGIRIFGHSGNVLGYSAYWFFLPDHGVGAVLLTNIGDPPFFRPYFLRRLLELVFDGQEEAWRNLGFTAKAREEAHVERLRTIDRAPGRAFFEAFVGAYRHPVYGKLTVRVEGDGAVLDVGEWRAGLGRKRASDGTDRLVAVTPPWLDWPSFARKDTGADRALVLDGGARPTVFERTEK